MNRFREGDLTEEFKRMLRLADIPLIEESDKKNKDRKVTPELEIDVEEVTGAKELAKLGRGIVEKNKKKKDCKKGNKNHDADGKFSTKAQAASWSGGYEHAEDCYYGKWKYPGGRTKLMTKHKCGKKKDGRKHRYRCKDGSEVYEEQLHDEALVECMRGYGGIRALIAVSYTHLTLPTNREV